MGITDNDTGTDEIKIGKEGYLTERIWKHSLYDEDQAEKAAEGSMVPANQGCAAAPTKTTTDKFYSRKRHRNKSRKVPECHALLTVGGCTETLQYTEDLQRVTDYHGAMIDLMWGEK